MNRFSAFPVACLLLVLALVVLYPPADAATLSVMSYGAKCDGKKDDTVAIRAALAAANAGDTVTFPANKTCKITDSISPKAGTTLQGLPGSKIVQAGNHHLLVITAPNVSTNNLTLRHNSNAVTSNVIYIDGAAGFYLYNTTIERTDSWNIKLFGGCSYGNINGLTIMRGRNGNIDDGVDFGECHDITLQRFDIHTNDDAISFKSYNNVGGTHHITVTNGTVRSEQSGAIAFGTEIDADLHAILVEDVEIVESLHGIFFKLYDGHAGAIYDVEIRNINHHDDLVAPWPQTVIYFRNLDGLVTTTNVWIHDYSYSGESWDGVHLMRTSGVTISAFAATVPAHDSRWALWLEDADDNVFDFNTSGFTGHTNINAASTGNTLMGLFN